MLFRSIPGVTAELLAARIESDRGGSGKGGSKKGGPRVEFAPDFAAAIRAAASSARDGDMILTLGAGSVSQLAPQILAALESKP